MGAGIAQIAALGGYETRLHDPVPAALETGHRAAARGARRRAPAKGLWSEEEADAASGRVGAAPSLADLAECDLVVEAAPEDLELKRELFAALAEACGPETILASNTSSLPVTAIAAEVPAARARRRHALLQPAGADEAGRGRRHRRLRAERRSRRPPRSAGAWAARRSAPRTAPASSPTASPAPSRLESLRMLADGRRRRGDDRPRLPPRRRLPHGPVRADRPDRPRRQPQRRPLLLRPGRRAGALAPEPDPGADGRRGPARAQERPRLLRLRRRAAHREPDPDLGHRRRRRSTPTSWRRSTPPPPRSSPASSPRSPTRRPSRSKRRSARPPTWTPRCGSASTGRAARSS